MKSLLKPKSIAVIGVSHDPQKIGHIIFDNLLGGYKGKLYGVNPKGDMVLGQTVYKTVLDINEEIELAIIAVPAPIVPRVMESCGKKKVKSVIIISSGFSEAGHIGKELEEEVQRVARKFHIRVLGPNCLGVINNFENLNASFASSKLPAKYKVGIFSQSGAMGSAILDFANGHNFGFSYFVSLGNKTDISEIDLLESWAKDENVQLAIGYLEDVRSGQAFIEAAKKFTSHKPLIILKGGMSKEGNKASHLHTAALAQDEVVFKAAMQEAGVILARNLGDLFELGVAFSSAKMPKGNRLAIVSNAGGPSVLGADACAVEKVQLPELSSRTIHEITKKTNPASLGNPIDLRGDAVAADFRSTFWALDEEKGVDGIVVIVTPQAMTEVESIAHEVVNYHETGKKPIYVNFIGGELVSRAIEIAGEAGVPTFAFPERAIRAFGFQSSYQKKEHESQKDQKKHRSHKVVSSLIHFSNEAVGPERLNNILEKYGIRMAKTVLLKNVSEVEAALKTVKPPVVMKIASPDILHKTDVGGIVMAINSPAEAKAAFQQITKNVAIHAPKAKIWGVTMMETAKEGLELIVGGKKDPVFGPVVMFGFGGIYVELVSDFGVALAPFTAEKIKRLIESTAVFKIIKGYRGQIGYSEEKLIETILAIGNLLVDHPEIKEVEINPIVLTQKGEAIGLDAKIELELGHKK